MKFENLMIDIETIGDTPGNTLLSIAAIPFNLTDVGESFFVHIKLEDALKFGGPSASTMLWWTNQDPELYKGTGAGLGEDPTKIIEQKLDEAVKKNKFLNI